MIVWLWRVFRRYVIGGSLEPKCRRDFCPHGRNVRSPICVFGWCRACCTGVGQSYDGSCKCEKKLTADELDMVARFRADRALGEVER